MPNRKRKCPYTDARLLAMYWREGKTSEQIALHCAESGEESRPSRQTVLQWIDDAGITRKTRSEAMKSAARKNPESFAKRARHAAAIHKRLMIWGQSSTGDASQMHTARIKRKAAAASRAVRYIAPMETRPCVVCGISVTKKAHRFQSLSGGTCGRKCTMQLLAQLKQIGTPPIECVCPVCKSVFNVPPSRLKHGITNPCCSRSCSNKNRAGRVIPAKDTMTKKQFNIRLPDATQKQLEALTAQTGMTQTQLLILAIEKLYSEKVTEATPVGKISYLAKTKEKPLRRNDGGA